MSSEWLSYAMFSSLGLRRYPSLLCGWEDKCHSTEHVTLSSISGLSKVLMRFIFPIVFPFELIIPFLVINPNERKLK